MRYESKEHRQSVEFRKLRREYDYLRRVFGDGVPDTPVKAVKFAKSLVNILENRFDKAHIFRSKAIKIPLPDPEEIDFIIERPGKTGIRKRDEKEKNEEEVGSPA